MSLVEIQSDLALRDLDSIRKHIHGPNHTSIFAYLCRTPTILFELPELVSDFTTDEQITLAKFLVLYSHNADLVRVSGIIPVARHEVSKHILSLHRTAVKTHKYTSWSYPSFESRVIECLDVMRLFVIQNPEYSVPFMTHLFRFNTSIELIARFVRERKVNWKPHMRTIQNWAFRWYNNDKFTVIMQSGLWKYWLESCLFSMKGPRWVLSESIRHIPERDSQYWQERFFRAKKLDIAVEIAKIHPDSSGPGRDHIKIQELHDC